MGLLAYFKRLRDARRRIVIEDALKHMHSCEWQGYSATTESLAGALELTHRAAIELSSSMQAQGWLTVSAGGLRLTTQGRGVALQIIRAHRLWERYLVDEARMPLEDVHREADRREHRRSAESIQELDAALGYPATDPHGAPIPTAEGQMPCDKVVPLTEWPAGEPAEIAHLEDEPKEVFSQIAAEGLLPGQRVSVIESDATRVVFADESQTHVLAPVVAANIFVAPVEAEPVAIAAATLASLEPGDTATVDALSDSLRGYTRRRLLDLGLTRGAAIMAEYSSFLGDPMAFRVRGSLIALRRDQAEQVLLEPIDSKESKDG